MNGKSINELKSGDKASFSKTLTETDVYLFAGITGDINPIHINKIEAENSIFKERVVHGMLSGGLISAVIGMQLPGPGSIYLEQNLKFTAPVKIGDTITATVEIVELNIEKNKINLKTTCQNQDGKIVIDGIATVKPPKRGEI